MHIADDVARLQNLGSKYSVAIVELGKSVDALAKLLIYAASPRGTYREGHPICDLPRHWNLSWWPSGDYALSHYGDSITIRLTNTTKSREDMLLLAEDIADGWLQEVIQMLEGEINEATEAIATINTGVATLSED